MNELFVRATGASFVLGLAATLVACTPSRQKEGQGQQLVAALEEDVRASDPQRELYGLADAVHLHVVEGLVGLKDNLSVGLMLADAFKVSDDGRTYEFTLRDGVRFHNGATLDSSHVKWSWDYLMASGSLWRCRPLFAGEVDTLKVTAVETPNPRTVIYRLAQPYGGFLHSLARLDCAQTPVLHPSSLNSDGSWKGPVATGPFVMGEHRIGQHADVRKFAAYSSRSEPMNGMVGGKRPLVDRIRFMIVGDPAARMLGLESGNIHIATVASPLVESAASNPQLNVETSPTTVWMALMLDQRDPVLRDRRIRQAISAAIDRDAVAKAVTYGQVPGSASPIPRGTEYSQAGPSGSDRADPARARQLLAEAGYRGQPITITTNKRFAPMFDMAVVVERMLRAAGINAKIEVIEWSLQLSRYNEGDYQALAFGYSGRFSPSGMWDRFIGDAQHFPWKDPRAIALVEQAGASTSPTTVAQSLAQLQSLFEEDAPAISLFHAPLNVVTNKRVSGYQGSYFEALRLWNVALESE